MKRLTQTMSFSSAVKPRTWTEYLAKREQGGRTEVSERDRKRLVELERRRRRTKKRTLGNLFGKLNGLHDLVDSGSDGALDGSVVLSTGVDEEKEKIWSERS